MSKKRPKYSRPPQGTHLDKNAPLNPRKPAPREPGVKRGIPGKRWIQPRTLNTICYLLSPQGRTLTHHELSYKVLTGEAAVAFIRDWIGLSPDDFCQVIKTSQSFPEDMPSNIFQNWKLNAYFK